MRTAAQGRANLPMLVPRLTVAKFINESNCSISAAWGPCEARGAEADMEPQPQLQPLNTELQRAAAGSDSASDLLCVSSPPRVSLLNWESECSSLRAASSCVLQQKSQLPPPMARSSNHVPCCQSCCPCRGLAAVRAFGARH